MNKNVKVKSSVIVFLINEHKFRNKNIIINIKYKESLASRADPKMKTNEKCCNNALHRNLHRDFDQSIFFIIVFVHPPFF